MENLVDNAIYSPNIYQVDSRVQPNFYNWRQMYSIFYLNMTCIVRNTATFSLVHQKTLIFMV